MGDSPRTTYSEVLSYVAPPVGQAPKRLSDTFDDIDATDPRSVLDAIRDEWVNLWCITPDKIVAGWRHARLRYPITLPSQGWLIDIGNANSLAAINGSIASTVASHQLARLTTADLFGENRQLTVDIASWIRSQVLFDGSLAHGVQYASKHGTNAVCWALWLRQTDDGQPHREQVIAGNGQQIDSPQRDSDLKWSATTMKVKLLGN